MRTLLLAALLASATPAVANDVFQRSFESGVKVYRGIPVHPDYAAIARIETAKAAERERARLEKLQYKRLKAEKRQAAALEAIAANLETAARSRPAYPAPYSAGVFFDGPYSRFPIIQPRPFVTPRRPGRPGRPRY